MTRESSTAAISKSVAENAVCWCEGRSARDARLKKLVGGADISADSTWLLRDGFRAHLTDKIGVRP